MTLLCLLVDLGLTGVGGGIIALLLQVYIAGLSLLQAAPLALVAVCIASPVGTGLGLREGIVY